jgi:endonuclease-3
MKSQKEFIKQIDLLLRKHFGIPKRNKQLPKPLDLLIATILSQNTNDANSYKAYQNLKANYKTWTELLNEKRHTLKTKIKVAGLAEQKSKAIKNLVVELNKKDDLSLNSIKNLDNENAIKQLTNYKGIGTKTASCVLLFAFDRNICPVDTHVHRTLNRIGIANEKTPDKTFIAIHKNIPDGVAHSFHTNLIRLGREICRPNKPSCGICPLLKICKYEKKHSNNKNHGTKKEFMLLDNVT